MTTTPMTTTPRATTTAAPTSTPRATTTMAPTSTPKATTTMAPTSTPKATTTMAPTSTPKATTTMAPTTTPGALPSILKLAVRVHISAKQFAAHCSKGPVKQFAAHCSKGPVSCGMTLILHIVVTQHTSHASALTTRRSPSQPLCKPSTVVGSGEAPRQAAAACVRLVLA